MARPPIMPSPGIGAGAGADPNAAAAALAGAGGGAGAPDPNAGAGDGSDAGDGSNVVCTIVDNGDGSYTVYAGDEPDSGDMSEDDAGAMGGAGDMAAPAGTPADSVGAALKAALDIMNAAKSSAGAPGSADDQFQAGFSGNQAPTAAGAGGAGGAAPLPQKY